MGVVCPRLRLRNVSHRLLVDLEDGVEVLGVLVEPVLMTFRKILWVL